MSICTCYIGVKEGKIKKRRQNELQHLYFHLHNTLSLPEGVHKCPYVLGVTEAKIEHLKKEGKIRISILIFIYIIHFAYLKVYTKFENTGSNR